MSMEDMKYCRYCKTSKSHSEFQKHRAKCRPCRTLETNEWNSKNREQHNKYQKEYKHRRYNQDINFKIKAILRARIRKFLKNGWKSGSSVDLLGCSIENFKLHIQSKWQSGMTWDNWSKLGWHIDHIIPLNSFDLSNPEELKQACHYTNLQPLWSQDNAIKSDKVQ